MLDVVIIGAGPAGLAAGYLLKKEGLDLQIVDPGSSAGGSWWRMPDQLRMVSPWHSNLLPGSMSRAYRGGYRAPAREYAQYLDSYATDHSLPLVLGQRVTRVKRDSSGFSVWTRGNQEIEGETFRARVVINATGYYSHPFIPRYPGLKETAIPQIHFADFRDAEDILGRLGRRASDTRVLIVGKRLSAGQIMLELHDAGFSVALSARSKIRFGPSPFWVSRFFEIFPDLESIYLGLLGRSARGYDVLMEGGRARKLISSGAVKVYPEIQEFTAGKVRFQGGEEEPFDLVFYATGFVPAFPHLANLVSPDPMTGCPPLDRFESTEVPGLFFLGLQDAGSFRSRFLRGIREDAFRLASAVTSHLRSASR